MTDPSILCHPNIPKPLHGIAPRVILGEAWWDVERKKVYEAAGFCCEACGIPKDQAKYHQWLEAHEFYEFDHGILRLKKLVALCHRCHNFIHSGRLEMLLDRKEITEDKFNDIMNHGFAVLEQANLLDEYEDRNNYPGPKEWTSWKMEINGVFYGPSSNSYEDWLAGAWRSWKPSVQPRPKFKLKGTNE